MSRTIPQDLAELVRLPAVASIPGDAWAGAGASGWRPGWAMPAASALLYLGGMAFNDWSDRDLDAVERPERPIPSGRVDADLALAVSAGLLVGGVAVAAAVGGRRGAALAVPLAASVIAYDLAAKDTALGPVVMAACRGLDVAMGAAGGDRGAATPAIAAAAAHALGVTQLSRHEVHGGAGPSARAAAGMAGLAAVLVQVEAWRSAGPDGTDGTGPSGVRTWLARVGAAAGAAAYLREVLAGYRAAMDAPDDPATVQAAVGGGVMANTTLQAGLLAGSGSWVAAAATVGATQAVGALRRRFGGGAVT